MVHSGEIPDLSGDWLSRYLYYSDSEQAERDTEHRLRLVQVGDDVTGTSHPDLTGSELELHLVIRGRKLDGRWHEKTSPRGEFKGRVLEGLVMFAVGAEGSQINGKRLIYNPFHGRVNVGEWVLDKVSSE